VTQKNKTVLPPPCPALPRRPVAARLAKHIDQLLFLRAYPPDALTLRRVEKALRQATNQATRIAVRQPAAFEAPEVSGIGGTAFTAIFSYEVARRLAELERGRVKIDWDNYEIDDRLAPAWRRLFALAEEDLAVEAHVPYLEWLQSAAGSPDRTLEELLLRLHLLPITGREKADLYATLQLPLRWELGGSPAARTSLPRRTARIFYHRGPLISRSEVSLEKELCAPPPEVELVDLETGQAFLNMAVATSAARQRELYGFTYGDPATVRRADLGRGVEVFLCGVPTEWRLPLRAYHAAMIFKNGVPVGYFETLSLFERMEVGFNIYYTFRGGESAWIFARLLRLFNQWLGVTSFSIDPYQIGRDNQEAIDSGAFWFYRKLGFRPAREEILPLLEREECRLREKPGYRTPPAILRKLCVAPLVYDMSGTQQGVWDHFHIRNVALRLQQRSPAEAAERVARALRVKVGPHREFINLALVVDAAPDLEAWPAQDKQAIMNIVRAKMGAEETEYLRLMRQHRRLREIFLRLGTQREPMMASTNPSAV